MTTALRIRRSKRGSEIRIAGRRWRCLLGAGLILVMFVLPAEYDGRPARHRRKHGVARSRPRGQQVEALWLAATDGATATIVAPQDRRSNRRRWSSRSARARGWNTSTASTRAKRCSTRGRRPAPVNYEFHAEPDGAPRGYAQTYEKVDRKTEASGTLTAPFPGIHGWYWENTTDQEITVTLTTAGYYNLSHEFRSGQPTKNKTF